MHWTKNFNFLKKKLLRLLHISYIYLIRYKIVSIIVVHNVIIIGTTVGCIFSASCSNYAFHASIFSAQQTLTTSYFRPTILGLVGKISSWLKSNKRGGGVAIRMSWCVFFEKINSRGGDVYSGLESSCFTVSSSGSNLILEHIISAV